VRNEAILAAALLCLAVGIAWWRSRQRPSARVLAGVTTAFVALVSLHLACDNAVFGSANLFSKGSNLGRAHVEMLDPREAARETYGTAEGTPAQPKVGPVAVAGRVLERWPRNFVYTLERLPGVLLSPLFLLALLLPAMTGRRGSVPAEELPLLAFAVWPLLFYPLLQLEPRMLLPLVIGTCIFGAAALVAAGKLIARRVSKPALQWVPAALVILALLPVLPVLARHTEAERGFHREVGAWIAANVGPDVTVTGDGYGYVTASGFWAGRRTQARIWTDDSAALGRWVADRSPGIVILYERYLRESNPELLKALDDGLPGLEPMREFDGDRAGRVRVWRASQLVPPALAARPGAH